MKKFLLKVLVLAVILLDYAALDDITTGKETNFLLEYLIIFGSLAFFAVWIFLVWRKKKTSK